MAKLNRYPDAPAAAAACGRRFLDLAAQAMEERGVANVAISGGSSPMPMFKWMALQPIAWDRLHLFWVDERAVPPSDSQSNYRLAFEALIEPHDREAERHRERDRRRRDDGDDQAGSERRKAKQYTKPR